MPTNLTKFAKYQKQRKLLMEQYRLNVKNVKGNKKPLDSKPIVIALSVVIVLVACLVLADNINCHVQGLTNYCY